MISSGTNITGALQYLTPIHITQNSERLLGFWVEKRCGFMNLFSKKIFLVPVSSNLRVPMRGNKFPQGFFKSDEFSITWRFSSVSSVAQSCPTLCHPMYRSMPGLSVHHQLQEFIQTHVYQVGGVIQPSHPLSSPSLPAPNPSQIQGLFQWVSALHEVGKVSEFQL